LVTRRRRRPVAGTLDKPLGDRKACVEWTLSCDDRHKYERLFEYHGAVSDTPLAHAHRLAVEALEELDAAASRTAGETELLSVLTLAEGLSRQLDRVMVGALADLGRRGTFAERGYRSAVTALEHLVGWERFDARRRLLAAEHVHPRAALDGTPLPPRLPHTAEALAAGAASLRHVEVIAKVLGTDAAARLSPGDWAAAEKQLAAWIPDCPPGELQIRGSQLVEALDADGPEPDQRPQRSTNELFLTRNPNGVGGKLNGRFDDAAMFDAIATLVDTCAAPRTADDARSAGQRQAEALADACAFVLDHGASGQVPKSGGRRPHLNVLVRLEDLENRARAACLDFGGTLSPESLRMLCCDAAVVPIVLAGTGQPLDVGRATRTIPDGLRRAITARDRGCVHCGRPASWCEVHHIKPWQDGGETSLRNCLMLCKACHRLIHHAGWDVTLVDGWPEFHPPGWIDPQRRSRRRPRPVDTG